MSLDFEANKDIFEEEQARKTLGDFAEASEVEPETGGGIKVDFSFLMAKTGDGSISDYINHPLNFSSSKGVAQVLRGFTGLVGELDLAIVDIAIGSFNIIKEGKKNDLAG